MGNLDWGSKFPLDMSQNRDKGKKNHPVDRNLSSFWTIYPLFWWNGQKVKKMYFFFTATTFIKHTIHNFDFFYA